MNPMSILKLKSIFSTFKSNHPKFSLFISAVSKKVDEGSVIEVRFTNSKGESIVSNIKLTNNDLDLIEEFRRVKNS